MAYHHEMRHEKATATALLSSDTVMRDERVDVVTQRERKRRKRLWRLWAVLTVPLACTGGANSAATR